MPLRLDLLALFVLITPTGLSACSPATTEDEAPPQNAQYADATDVAPDGFSLHLFDNSTTFSQVLAMNARGAVIGTREVIDQSKTVLSSKHFYSEGEKTIDIPLLKGYTNLEVQALSDDGKAAGFASRGIGHPQGSLTAIVWDQATGVLTNLGHAPGDNASHAQDISADGTRITGYSTGANPPRMRPCVWTWNPETRHWDAQVLSTIYDNNPYLLTSRAIVCPNGQRVAACITVGFLPGGGVDSSLFVWEFDDGKWIRQPVCDEQMRLRDMTNDGVMAGAISAPAVPKPCRVGLDGKVVQIDLLDGDVSGEAWGVNAAGTVVGFSDDPRGPIGGPQAFIWRDGKTRPLPLFKDSKYSAAYTINELGEVGGLVDVTFPARPSANNTAPTEAAEPLIKTLGFRWSPTAKPN